MLNLYIYTTPFKNYLTYNIEPTQVSTAAMHINCVSKVCH